jgi:hypothetical protein
LGAVQNADGTTSYHVGIGKEGPGGKWSSYDQDGIDQKDVAAIVTRETLKYLVQSGQTSGLSDTTQKIVGSTKFGSETDVNQIQADLVFADTYDQIVKLANGTDQYGKQASAVSTALDGADKFFADATTQAQALGLATDQFAQAAQNAKTTIGTNYLQGLQDELDNANGKGFLKSLRDYEQTASQQFDDLQKLFDKGAITQSQLDTGNATAKALQAQMISNALAKMTASQITDVVNSFANDTTDFGKAIEAAALAVQNGTATVSGSGIDAQTFHDQTQVPMDAALRNAQSALDPTVKAFNDALNLQEQRDVALRAALAVDNLSASQKSYIETTMKATWALQDQAAAAQKAQTAMANATTTIANLGTTINDYINKASVDQFSGKSPIEILQATKTQYETQMRLAQEGNANALGSITTYAQNYRQAIQTYYGTGTQGASLSQGVLDQLAGLPNTPGLATALANNTLRNQGDDGITIGSDGSIYQNGKKIGFTQTPTAPNDISAFDLAAGQYNNGMSAQAYQALVGIRDAILSGYNDTQLQAVSNKYYGGVAVGSLSGFESLLHSMDTGWLNSPNQPWNQTGGSESGGNAPLIKASNDNADTISKAVQAMQKSVDGDLNLGSTNVAALMQTFRDQTHLDLVGPTGSVAFGLNNVAATIHADFTGTLGQAVNSLTTLVASLQAALQASQNQVAGLTAQLMAAQQAMADQAAADAKALLAATNKQTAVIDRQGAIPGGRTGTNG